MKGVDTSGDRIGRYRLLEKIGEGGMGVVHLGVDSEGRKVAIKVLRSSVASDSTALRRLAREVDTMRRVHSPHVAEIIDADVTASPPYVVTQYVPGRTLDQLVEAHGPLRGYALQRLARGLAMALAAIHAAGVVHRDMKPGNVMFLENGEPVVIDFGIAMGTDMTRLTATGLVIGTPGYLAPEIIEGDEAGAPADVHSWASTLAFAATGRPPYGSGAFESIFYKIMEGRPDLAGCPDWLLPVLRGAMTRHPAERPRASALAERISRIDLNAPSPTRIDVPAVMTKTMDAVPDRTAHADPVAPPYPQRPQDFRDVLPPVAYGPPQPPPAQPPLPPQSGEYRPREALRPTGWHRLHSLLLMAFVVGMAGMLPWITAIVVLTVLAVFRVTDRTGQRLAAGHSPVSAAAKTPFSAIGAVLKTLCLTPIGILTGFVVLFGLLLAKNEITAQRAIAWSVAAFLIVACLGPGSSAPRRQVTRMFARLAPAERQSMIIAGSLGLLALLTCSFALVVYPVLEPFDFNWLTEGLESFRDGVHDILGIK